MVQVMCVCSLGGISDGGRCWVLFSQAFAHLESSNSWGQALLGKLTFIRASMEVKMNKSCTVSACQKPHKGQMWAITVHCVCQRRAKLTAFTPGFLPRSELFLSCDPDLGLDLHCVVVWEQGRIWILLVALFIFFPHPIFQLVSLRANANRIVNIHPKILHGGRANSKTALSASQSKPCSSTAAA